MALPEPCIPGLVGCPGGHHYELSELPSFRYRNDAPPTTLLTDTLSGGPASSSSSSAGTLIAQTNTYNPYIYTPPTTSSSAASATNGTTATYYLNVRNTGTKALSNVTVTHGPRPAGTEFLQAQSTPGCAVNGTNVNCTMSLAPGEMRTFQLGYSLGSKTCATTPTLQTALTSVGTQASTTVTTDVSCTMTMTSSVAPLPPPQTVTQMPVYTAPETIKQEEYKDGYKGYKPTGYKPVPPRTGASDTLFAAVTQNSTLTPVRTVETSSNSLSMPTIILGLAIVLVGTFVAYRAIRFFRKG